MTSCWCGRQGMTESTWGLHEPVGIPFNEAKSGDVFFLGLFHFSFLARSQGNGVRKSSRHSRKIPRAAAVASSGLGTNKCIRNGGSIGRNGMTPSKNIHLMWFPLKDFLGSCNQLPEGHSLPIAPASKERWMQDVQEVGPKKLFFPELGDLFFEWR